MSSTNAFLAHNTISLANGNPENYKRKIAPKLHRNEFTGSNKKIPNKKIGNEDAIKLQPQ